MLLWIVFAILAVTVTGALLRPLQRDRGDGVVAADADLAIYRDQLSEIESDKERGLINETEALSARAEVGRRILARAEKIEGEGRAGVSATRGASPSLIKAVAIAVPVLSLVLYLAVGSPHLSGQPFATREAPVSEGAPINELVAKVEARLKAEPNDGRGWEVIGPVYMRLGRTADAANAFAQAMRINGESEDLLIAFAEASLLAGNGIVNDGVRRAAERLLAINSTRLEPHLWMALGKEQDGDLKGAIVAYRALLERPAVAGDKHWRGAVESRIAMVESRMSGQPLPAAPAPDARDAPPEANAAAVAELPPEQQAKFVESMVAKLAERLKANGKDLEGWQKLVRAYSVLGRKDEAKAALGEAKTQFKGDAAAETTLADLAQSLGLAE